MDIYLSSIAVLSRFGLIEVATQYTWPSENAEGYYEWTCSSELKEQVYQPLVWIREFVHPKKGSADDMDHPITHKVLRMLTLKYDQNKREDWYSSLLIKLNFFCKRYYHTNEQNSYMIKQRLLNLEYTLRTWLWPSNESYLIQLYFTGWWERQHNGKKESWKLMASKGKGSSMFTQLILCFAQVVSMKQMIGRPETKMNISLICIILILFIEHMNITKISYTIHSNFWDFRNTNDIIYWTFHCDAKLESLILKFWNANPRWFGNITMNIYEFNSAVNHMRLDHC